jgi:WD40 repeat protein
MPSRNRRLVRFPWRQARLFRRSSTWPQTTTLPPALAEANCSGRGVNIYDLASGRRLYSLPDVPGSIWCLAWHPDGRHRAVARGDGDISIWNLTEVEGLLAKVGRAP